MHLLGIQGGEQYPLTLVAEDVHPISLQRKPNGFIFLRELEIQGKLK